MLILSRKRHETICIGDDIRVTVSKIENDTVRIGIEAPPHVAVHRLEVLERIKRGGDDATTTGN